MPNLLTAQAGLKLGPIVLETFFKHYLERKSEAHDKDGQERSTNLRHDELLWQESFEIVKSFLNQATKHTVEELQEFSNARIPAPPWIWVSRVLVPMTSCDLAATHLIKALGGEEVAKRVVGGTKWWQVRGMRGVDCQWVCQKSHMQNARKRKREKNGLVNGPMRSPSSPRFPSIRKFSNSWTSPRSTVSDDTPQSPGDEEQNDQEIEDDKEVDITDMNGTRCMLYAHGGGYYFGSVDQERYCMQRYARKINGRVFACNYRLSPQYPFPCAIQDMLAAYLYLIDPPPEAPHCPVTPDSIVLGGDSAGGGLCLAVLQVIRDSGIPLPAGAVLISPWGDLTHSFPSTIHNTVTDIIPPYGLSLHKPSVLWPPPPDEISSKVRAGLRARFQKVGRRAAMVEAFFPPGTHDGPPQVGHEAQEVVLGPSAEAEISNPMGPVGNKPYIEDRKDSHPQATTTDPGPENLKRTSTPQVSPIVGKPPLPWESTDNVHLNVDGKSVTINTQIQLYCPNSLLVHPLVSPALSYLGGLPPLLVIASDKEVLRDEIIYLAHKAAYPDKYPVNEDSKKVYPPLRDIDDKHRPTPVHLQVYDETAHVLPLFSFTTPAKYCYRAIASFTKFVTTPLKLTEPLPEMAPETITAESKTVPLGMPQDIPLPSSPNVSPPHTPQSFDSPSGMQRVSSIFRSHSSLIIGRSMKGIKGRNASEERPQFIADPSREDSGDVAGNRFKHEIQPRGPGTAGDPSVYTGFKTSRESPLGDVIIRERISTQGVIRPLEPETELAALQLQPACIGKINEAAARRYIEGNRIWAKKFAKTTAKIETQRLKNLELAKGETTRTVKTMAQLQEHLFREQDALDSSGGSPKQRRASTFSPRRSQKDSFREGSDHAERQTWGWAWALDGEHPPPSSIVSRRDTVEARNLARVADLSMEQEESKLSGNMLWSVLVNFLTAHPSHKGKKAEDEGEIVGAEAKGQSEGEDKRVKNMTTGIFRRITSFRASGKPREHDRPPGLL